MKRYQQVLLMGFLAVIAVTQATAQNGIVAGYCVQGATQAKTSGLPSSNYLQGLIPSCTVTVYYTGTTTPVPGTQIFSDTTGTVLGNPFSATFSGKWQFYASVGNAYDVALSGGVFPNIYTTPVTLTALPAGPLGSVFGQANGVIPLATGPASIGAQSHLDDGVTTPSVVTSTEPIKAPEIIAPNSPFPTNTIWIQEGASISYGFNTQEDIGLTQTPGSGYALSGTPTCAVNGGTFTVKATCVAYLSGTGIVVLLSFPGALYTVAPTSVTVTGFVGGSGFSVSASILPNPYNPSYSQAALSLPALAGRVSSFTNYAISGTTVLDAIGRFSSNSIAAKCASPNPGSWVVYDIGGDLASNSLGGNAGEGQTALPGDQVFAQYISLARMAKAAGCKVVAESVLPRGSEWSTTTQQLFELNRIIFNQLLHQGVLGTDFDYYIPVAESIQNNWDPTIFSIADYVHLNSFGNRFFAQIKNGALLNPQGAFQAAAYMPSFQTIAPGPAYVTNPQSVDQPVMAIYLKGGNIFTGNGQVILASDTSQPSNPVGLGFCAGATSATFYGGCAEVNSYDAWVEGADLTEEIGGGVFGDYNFQLQQYAWYAKANASGISVFVPHSTTMAGATVNSNQTTDAANQLLLAELSGTAFLISEGPNNTTNGIFNFRCATSTGAYLNCLSVDGSGNATVPGGYKNGNGTIIPATAIGGNIGVSTGQVALGQTCTSGSITPGTTAGATATGTCTLSAAATGHPGIAAATDGSVQGIVIPQVSVNGTTATVTLTTVINGSPSAKTYNVTVF